MNWDTGKVRKAKQNTKIILDQNNNTEYMVQYRMLKFHVKIGVKVKVSKPEEYYNALMYSTERTVDECRIQENGDNMTTTKTSNISLHKFDDKRFYINNIKSYPHDKNIYLFKRDLVNKINNTVLELLIKLGLHVSKES